MSRFETTSFDWVFGPPKESLTAPFLSALPSFPLWISLCSSLVSIAFAEALMATSPREAGLGLMLSVANFWLSFFAFLSVTGLLHRILRLVSNEAISFSLWLRMGMLALLPIHLTLPLALLCRPMGAAGILVYSLFKLHLWTVIIRRWGWGVQNMFGWPLWGGILLVMSPFLLGCLGFFVLAAFLMACVSVLLLGLLL